MLFERSQNISTAEGPERSSNKFSMIFIAKLQSAAWSTQSFETVNSSTPLSQ
jgi:hypothetical protein